MPAGPNKAAEILEPIKGTPSLPTALPVITQASFVWPITNEELRETNPRSHIVVIILGLFTGISEVSSKESTSKKIPFQTYYLADSTPPPQEFVKTILKY